MMTRFPACRGQRAGESYLAVARRRSSGECGPDLPDDEDDDDLTKFLTSLRVRPLGSWVDEERSKLSVDM